MRILIADDHQLVRAGIRPFLEELPLDSTSPSPGGAEITEADSLDAALDLVAGGLIPDLAVLDLKMPGMGDDGLLRFRAAAPQTPVVILSASMAAEDVLTALAGGAAGYLPKTFGGPTTQACLRVILAGERFFPAFALETLATRLAGTPAGRATASTGRSPRSGHPGGNGHGDAGPLDLLSPREREILALMIDGGTNKEIARQLEVQEITVKVHLRNIYRKLGAGNRAQAVRIALENGWTAGRSPAT